MNTSINLLPFDINFHPALQLRWSGEAAKPIAVTFKHRSKGVITCRLSQETGRPLSTVTTLKERDVWNFRFSSLGLETGNYWISVQNEEQIVMQRFTIP